MNITILTGAGLSAESGLGTFRDKNGLWTQYDLAQVATPEGFAADADLVHRFYNARRENCMSATPNAAHMALARLSMLENVTLITQNVDDLLERAGAQNVIHMHGELMRGLCAACGHRWDVERDMHPDAPCPACKAAHTRPDVVWFGEMPYHMETCEAALWRADVFAAIGTSAEVYPAAGFVDLARSAGAHTVELNLAPSGRAHMFDDIIKGPATQTIPAWVDGILDQFDG